MPHASGVEIVVCSGVEVDLGAVKGFKWALRLVFNASVMVETTVFGHIAVCFEGFLV